MIVFILLFLPPELKYGFFDVGAVTTGSLTVPFMMALGIGMAAVMAAMEKFNQFWNFSLHLLVRLLRFYY